jgi:hypothetical protein
MSRVETPGRLKHTGTKAMKELFLEILLNENIHTFIQWTVIRVSTVKNL